MGRGYLVLVAGLVATATAASVADAHSVRVGPADRGLQPSSPSVGGIGVPQLGPHRGSHGATIVVDEHGPLVAETNAGALVRLDAAGKPIARLQLSVGLAQLVTNGRDRAYVADRRAHRVLVVDTSDAKTLTEVAAIDIPEPYGLALTPDGATLLVTSVADQALLAVDVGTGEVRSSTRLAAEPRGVAVSADGREATVGFLSTGNLAVVSLGAKGKREAQVRWTAIDPRDPVEIEKEEDWEGEMVEVAVVAEPRSRFEVPSNTGQRRARNVFSVAYVGHGRVAAAHQLSTSQMKRIPGSQSVDSYGGGPQSVPAIVHQLSLVADGATMAPRVSASKIDVHQPRALAYDVVSDTLYVAGYGDDRIAAIADVSQPAPYAAWSATLSRDDETRPDICGIDGLAVDGEQLWVHCELTRRVFRLTPSQFDLEDKPWKSEKRGVLIGPELAASKRTPEVERGAELFRRGRDWRMSDGGVMACASCHPEGRADGLSWRLGKSILQTPMLAGRVVDTAPYKWDGQDADLPASFRHTIERLGGSESTPPSARELDDLAAYVHSLPDPTPPTVADPAAVARGKKLFEGDALDCTTCHDGPRLTDGQQYPLQSRGLDTTDTPSLVGLAHTAPYYHDGSAGDLYALLTDKGSVHDMAELDGLTHAQVADLTAYLRSL